MSEEAMSTARGVYASTKLLGRGIYDLVEAARMIRRDPYTVARWTQGEHPLHVVPNSPRFTFLDVISLYVISELRRRNVSMEDIRKGGEYLAEKRHIPYPFAHQQLATAGRAFLGNVGEWRDVGKRGQGTFEIIIQDVLRPIEFGSDELAAVWRPAEGVWVNPLIQAGAPCIDGTRVPTRLISDLAAVGERLSDISEDLALDISQLKAAVDYEDAA